MGYFWGERGGISKSKKNKDECSSSSEDSAGESEEEIDYEETEASCIAKCHDVAIVGIGDGFSYYLVKLSKDPFTTTESVKDDYGHYIPANTKVIEGNYLEIFKETKEGDLYYLDTSKLALISWFSVVGICPEFVEVEQMRRKKIETMFLVTHDMHQLLLEYTICGFWISEFELFLYLFWFIWHLLAVQVQRLILWILSHRDGQGWC